MDETTYLEAVIRGLVTVPEEVKIDKINDDRGIFLNVKVNSSDMGKIIGKEGKTAKLLRELMHIYGAVNGQNISFKILEPR